MEGLERVGLKVNGARAGSGIGVLMQLATPSLRCSGTAWWTSEAWPWMAADKALGRRFVTRDDDGHSVAHASLFIAKFLRELAWNADQQQTGSDVVREGFNRANAARSRLPASSRR